MRKLRRINSTKSIPQLIKIEQAICDSHLKERLDELKVTQIISSDMLKK